MNPTMPIIGFVIALGALAMILNTPKQAQHDSSLVPMKEEISKA